MAKKSKPPTLFVGLWHIISMETWDEDYFNEEVQAFIELEENGTGNFQFEYVQDYMDWRPGTRDGEPPVEQTWEDNDEMDLAQGRGWTKLEDEKLHGMIFFHGGDDSEFVAKKTGRKKSKR